MTTINDRFMQVATLPATDDDETAPLPTMTLAELKGSEKMIKRSPSWMWAYELRELFITGKINYFEMVDAMIAAVKISSKTMWHGKIYAAFNQCNKDYGQRLVDALKTRGPADCPIE